MWGRGDGEPERLLYEFRGFTKEPQWLEQSPAQPWQGVRHVRVETAASPSWPAWREIRIFGTGPG